MKSELRELPEMHAKRLLVQQAKEADAKVQYEFYSDMLVFEQGNWGPFRVALEFITEIEGRYGELAWSFLRYATTPKKDRLLVSRVTMDNWEGPANKDN